MNRVGDVTELAGFPLALTQGEPSGIGPELTLKAWLARTAASRPFFIIADPHHLATVAKTLGFAAPIETVDPAEATLVFRRALPVVPLQRRVFAEPGKPSPTNVASTIESIERAVSLVHTGHAAAVVTNPIAKAVLYASGFAHPGHTEFFAELALRHWGVVSHPVMMLWSRELVVVPVTVHVRLATVPGALTRDLIVATAKTVANDLVRRFGVANPRLALAGLNPHAGEGGSIGREDIDVIAPAVADLRAAGIDASGPHPADTLFHAAARRRYDAALAMYHDQALVPIKTIAFDSAVNVTLGLPFVRTSPDHGTAFDIAGRGVANPASLVAALELAARLTAS